MIQSSGEIWVKCSEEKLSGCFQMLQITVKDPQRLSNAAWLEIWKFVMFVWEATVRFWQLNWAYVPCWQTLLYVFYTQFTVIHASFNKFK